MRWKSDDESLVRSYRFVGNAHPSVGTQHGTEWMTVDRNGKLEFLSINTVSQDTILTKSDCRNQDRLANYFTRKRHSDSHTRDVTTCSLGGVSQEPATSSFRVGLKTEGGYFYKIIRRHTKHCAWVASITASYCGMTPESRNSGSRVNFHC
jgi:hypothetical protein